MTQPEQQDPSEQAVLRDRSGAILASVTFGVTFGIIGMITGLVLAVKRRKGPCSDGKVFPEGTTDFTCYVHPQAGVGIAVITISAMLAILIYLAAFIASEVHAARRDTGTP